MQSTIYHILCILSMCLSIISAFEPVIQQQMWSLDGYMPRDIGPWCLPRGVIYLDCTPWTILQSSIENLRFKIKHYIQDNTKT